MTVTFVLLLYFDHNFNSSLPQAEPRQSRHHVLAEAKRLTLSVLRHKTDSFDRSTTKPGRDSG